jgi:hypothetical protein
MGAKKTRYNYSMRRPQLLHFTAISTDQHLTIRASLSFSRQARHQFWQNPLPGLDPIRPIESLGLLQSRRFRLRLVGMDKEGVELLNREYDSDSFGDFNVRLPHPVEGPVARLMVYETRTHAGLDLLIGSFIPLNVREQKKLIITDFDKTLVDTRYHSPREVYLSLKKPLGYFPPVQSSIDLVKGYVSEGFHPFVVSASPHFYENAMRDWLYRNQIFTSNIYLKDYRRVFALFEGELAPKDIKTQGFYKLNHLVNILLMTGIPDELVLVGDGFESDTIIYLTLASVIVGRQDPWVVWNSVKKDEGFKLTNRQHFRFLSKFYQLKNLTDTVGNCDLKIHIRCRPEMVQRWKEKKFKYEFLNRLLPQVDFYQG